MAAATPDLSPATKKNKIAFLGGYDFYPRGEEWERVASVLMLVRCKESTTQLERCETMAAAAGWRTRLRTIISLEDRLQRLREVLET